MIYLLLILLHCAVQTLCLEQRFTVNVEPLTEDCFFQSLRANDKLQLDYQVISGGHGDLDISFNLAEPMGRFLVADFKKPEKTHNIDIITSGDYKFCFDNTFSSFNTKTVYFEIIVYNSLGDTGSAYSDISFQDVKTISDIQQIEGFQEVTDILRSHLGKARSLQDLIRLTEAKDRSIAEEMYFKVNTYSMFVLVVMIVVSFIQILMVKSIFDNKSQIHKFLGFLDVRKKS